nr:DNA/RNA non-specific endonuclease [Bifidobacterium catenulatum]
MSGQLHLKAERERLPIRDSLCAIGHGNELKTDERGHLIGDVFDGGNDMGNIVAMDGKVNRSAYKKLENKWRKKLEFGSTVEVKIKPIYEGDSARPSQFAIVDVIDEKKTSTFLKNL